VWYAGLVFTIAAMLALTGLMVWGIVAAWRKANRYNDPYGES
jgi:hypothetical protein